MYRHPSMDINVIVNVNLNSNCLTKFLDQVSKEQKSIFLLDRLLQIYKRVAVTVLPLDSLAASFWLPYILQPASLTDHSVTLMENIFQM